MEKTDSHLRSHSIQGNKASALKRSSNSGAVAGKNSGAAPTSRTLPAAKRANRAAAQAKTSSERREKASQFLDGVNQSLPRTLNDTFLDERNDVLSVINELEDQLDRYEEIRQSLEHDLTKKSEQLQTATQRVQELEWQVVTLQTRVDALEQVRQELHLLEEELGEANGRAQRAAEQCKRGEQDNTRLTAELKAASKQLEELWVARKERDGLRVDVRNLRGKVEQIGQANHEVTEERAQLQLRLREALTALDQKRDAQHQLERNLRVSDDRNREMQRVQEAVEERLEALRTEKKDLQAQLAHLGRENIRLVDQQQFYECELTSLRNVNRNAETALSNVKKAFAEVRGALCETKSRVRRRTIENSPRVNTSLRGIAAGAEDGGTGPDEGETVAADMGVEEELAAAGLGSADNSDPEDGTDI